MNEPTRDSPQPAPIDAVTERLAMALVERAQGVVIARRRARVFWWVGAAAAWVLVLVGVANRGNVAAFIALAAVISAIAVIFQRRPPDPGIQAAGVIRLPVANVPAGERGAQVDLSGVARRTPLRFAVPRDLDRLQELMTRSRLAVEELPAVLPRLPERQVSEGVPETVMIHDLEANLHEMTEFLQGCLEDRREQEVVLGLVDWFLDEEWNAREYEVAEVWPALHAEDADRISARLRDLTGAIAQGQAAMEDLGTGLLALHGDLERLAARLLGIRTITLGQAVPGFQLSVAGSVDLGSFNFYCPSCNAELVNGGVVGRPDVASRMVYEMERDRWRCLLCGQTTETPLPMPRILDELIMPAYEYLLEEHRVARLEIYNRAQEARQRFQNEWKRELERAFQGNRDGQQQLKARLRDLNGKIEGARKSLAAFGELLDDIESLRTTRLESVQRRYEEAGARIARDNRAFLERQNEFVQKLRTELQEEVEQQAELAHIEEQRRQELMQRMAGATERTAEATERTAEATERTAEHTADIAAVQKAIAHERGLDRGRGLLGVGKNVALAVEHTVGVVTGESMVEERADKRIR